MAVKTDPSMAPIMFWTSRDDAEALTDLAHRADMSRSELLRRVARDLLNRAEMEHI